MSKLGRTAGIGSMILYVHIRDTAKTSADSASILRQTAAWEFPCVIVERRRKAIYSQCCVAAY